MRRVVLYYPSVNARDAKRVKGSRKGVNVNNPNLFGSSSTMDDDIKAILSAYIDRRDNAKKSSPFYVAGNQERMTIPQFSAMVNNFHQQLFAHFPAMNLAEMEALSELVNSRLNWMRTS